MATNKVGGGLQMVAQENFLGGVLAKANRVGYAELSLRNNGRLGRGFCEQWFANRGCAMDWIRSDSDSEVYRIAKMKLSD